MVVDVNVGVGHGLEAFVAKTGSLNVPAFYFAGAADPVTAEWLLTTKRDWIATEFKEGRLKIAGCTVPPREIPGQQGARQPPEPQLNVLKLRKDLYPEVPDHVIKAGGFAQIAAVCRGLSCTLSPCRLG